MSHIAPDRTTENAAHPIPTVSSVLRDGTLLEMLYSKDEQTAALVRSKDGLFEVVPEHRLVDGRRLVPFTPTNNLLVHDVVLLPSAPEEYDTKAELLDRIRDFIHRYVDLTTVYEQIAAHYVLLTWLYDSFPELPYLRVQGEPGSGKTRFLLVVGSICNKPIFASGASTVSPLFRMLDSIRGTLVLDEADFRFSDEKSEVIKILNNGTCQGFPVLRSEQDSRTKEFNPRAYHVFGPKLVATRGPFDDHALETRFIAERMGMNRLRADVPISLSAVHRAEALRLRNQLLLFRLRERGRTRVGAASLSPRLEPRLRQMFGPLLSVVDDAGVRDAILALASERHRALKLSRSEDDDARVVDVLRGLWKQDDEPPTVGHVAEAFTTSHPGESATARWIGHVLRRRLGLVMVRRRDGFAIDAAEHGKIEALAQRLGLDPGG